MSARLRKHGAGTEDNALSGESHRRALGNGRRDRPLVAGAGVLGVAIGFGAQSLVRDVIAGMFYLLDDAFRVGEYIQSGNYKGTVESFSFRSVRPGHQRGALYTMPLALLGAVQNQSRDWTIDKLMVGITYDSNIELAKTLIKRDDARPSSRGVPRSQQGDHIPLVGEFSLPMQVQETTSTTRR